MGWLITLGILFLLAVLPLGVSVKYDSEGPLVKVIAGPLRITVFPLPKKEKKVKTKKETGKQAQADREKAEEAALPKPPKPPKVKKEQKPKERGGSLLDFIPFVRLGISFLGDFCRKLRLKNLDLKLILGSSDPCDLAVNYGKTWTAVANLLPHLDRWFVIKKRNVEVECDFTASETLVIARLDISITLGRLLSLVVVYAVQALIEFLKFKKLRKGGANS